MSRAKLIKKDSQLQEELLLKRKARRQRKPPKTMTRTAIEVTTEWLKNRRAEGGNARETFAALFAKPDPQSA